MKLTVICLLLLACCPFIVSAQHESFAQSTAAGDVITVAAQPESARKLPPHVVYRHFLAWVNQLDNEAKRSRSGDPYKFAEPFSRANLQHQHLDTLRDAARRLDTDILKHQARAQLVIARYRKEASRELAQGKPLPPAPPEIRQLERERTALLIQHYVAGHAALGPEASAQLDKYLNSEFAPHIELRRIVEPAPPQNQPGIDSGKPR